MSKHVAGTSEAELSPKVLAVGGVGLALTVVSVVLAGVTPEMLEALGAWAVPVAAGLVAGGGYLAGYARRDPLRELGGSAVAAGGVVPAFPAAAQGSSVATGEVGAEPVEEDPLVGADTAEADALAARAAAIRQGGGVS